MEDTSMKRYLALPLFLISVVICACCLKGLKYTTEKLHVIDSVKEGTIVEKSIERELFTSEPVYYLTLKVDYEFEGETNSDERKQIVDKETYQSVKKGDSFSIETLSVATEE